MTPDLEQLNVAVHAAWAIAEEESGRSFTAFLHHVIVDSKPPARYSVVAKEWQRDWGRQLAPLLEHVAGLRSERPKPDCHWRTLARGHDKTTGLGRACNWLLAFSVLPVHIKAAATDLDQAEILLESMEAEAKHNPWLLKRLEFKKHGAKGRLNGATLEVLASDAPSSSGQKPDLTIADEITNWRSRDLWNILVSAIDKRHSSMLVITNAGVLKSWQWNVKEECKHLSRWRVYEAPGRLDTWMSEEDLEESSRLLPPAEAMRLYWNRWVDAAVDCGYLSRADVEACVLSSLYRRLAGEQGVCDYVASLDYGPKRDRTALSVCHQDMLTGGVILDRQDVLQGSPQNPIQVKKVREWLDEVRAGFPGIRIVGDPSGLEELFQDLKRECQVESLECRASAASNHRMAQTLRSLIVNKKLHLYPRAGELLVDGSLEDLVDELASLVTRPVGAHYRFDHKSGNHDDRAVSLGMACVSLLDKPRSTPFVCPPRLSIPSRDILRTSVPNRYGLA